MKRNSGFILRNVAGESIIVPCAERAVVFNGLFTLNDVGTLIWEALARDCSLQDVAFIISKHYGIDDDQAILDANVFLTKMQSLGLVNND